jgi:hypothetical protein
MPQLNVVVSLSNLVSLAHWGRDNRNEKQSLIKRITESFKPSLLQVFTCIRDPLVGIVVVDGHHRMEGALGYCQEHGIDPSKIKIRCDIYDISEIKGDVGKFIDTLRKGLHDRSRETVMCEVSTHWGSSPWGKFLIKPAVTPIYPPGNYLICTLDILKASAIASIIQNTLQQNGGDVFAAMRGLPIRKFPNDQLLAEINSSKAPRRAAAVQNWITKVSSVTPGCNKLLTLVFLFLVLESNGKDTRADTRNIRPLIQAFTPGPKTKKKLPTMTQDVEDSLGKLLHYANFKIVKYRILMCGRDQMGRHSMSDKGW